MGRPLKGRGSQKTCLIFDQIIIEVRSLLLWGDGKNGIILGLYILESGIFFWRIKQPVVIANDAVLKEELRIIFNSKERYYENKTWDLIWYRGWAW